MNHFVLSFYCSVFGFVIEFEVSKLNNILNKDDNIQDNQNWKKDNFLSRAFITKKITFNSWTYTFSPMKDGQSKFNG